MCRTVKYMSFVNSLSTTKTYQSLREKYQQIRQKSSEICQPLAIEDYVIQTMPDVSPPKWHLAHTTWFFENFLLIPYLDSYERCNSQFSYLFNSYYEAVGRRYPRFQRGLLSRPTVEEIYRYRAYVDEAMVTLIKQHLSNQAITLLVELGLNHEQQHQELLLTDIKHILATNPLRPIYHPYKSTSSPKTLSNKETWLDYPGGIHRIGGKEEGFFFDNEIPQHQVYLQDYWLQARLVTNGEYLEFIEAGGYQKPEYWLAEGWTIVQQQQWQAPLYWEKNHDEWLIMTLAGLQPLKDSEPVCHVSFFEADAFARWVGKRLPTEAEWEVAATQVQIKGNFLEQGYFHPTVALGMTRPDQIFGDVWEWTQSAYLPYPGFKATSGAIGEYNGKFMSSQMVLRGGSCVTPSHHIRPTYRNFFPPHVRWQFSGIRLAA